jgi:hypothetical protein
MPLVSHCQVGATTVTDMWVRMAYFQFSRIIMARFKLSHLDTSFVITTECTEEVIIW